MNSAKMVASRRLAMEKPAMHVSLHRHPAGEVAVGHFGGDRLRGDADLRHLRDREMVLRHGGADADQLGQIRGFAPADHALTGTV